MQRWADTHPTDPSGWNGSRRGLVGGVLGPCPAGATFTFDPASSAQSAKKISIISARKRRTYFKQSFVRCKAPQMATPVARNRGVYLHLYLVRILPTFRIISLLWKRLHYFALLLYCFKLRYFASSHVSATQFLFCSFCGFDPIWLRSDTFWHCLVLPSDRRNDPITCKKRIIRKYAKGHYAQTNRNK